MSRFSTANLYPILHKIDILESELAHTSAAYHFQKTNTESRFQAEVADQRSVLPQIAKLVKHSYIYIFNLQLHESGLITFEGQAVYSRPAPSWKEGKHLLKQVCHELSSRETSVASKQKAARTLASIYNTFLESLGQHEQLLEQKIQSDCGPYLQKIQMLQKELDEIRQQYPRLESQLRECSELLRQGLPMNMECSLTQDLTLPIGAETFTYKGELYLSGLNEWDLCRDGILRIMDETPVGGNRSGLDEFLKDLALRFLCAYPHSALCLDYTNRIALTRLKGQLSPKLIQSFSLNSPIPSAFSLGEHINERFSDMGSSSDIFQYNLYNPSDPKKLLLVIVDEQQLRNTTLADTTLMQAHLAGVFFVIVSLHQKDSYVSSPLNDIPTRFYRYNGSEEQNVLWHDGNKLELRLRTAAQMGDLDICKGLNERTTEKSLPFDAVLHSVQPAKPFWDELIIPYGQVSGRLQTLKLDMTSVHTAILGPNGRGKSNLIDALILGAAYHYSPDECKIIIVDAEKSLGEAYKKARLPHLWFSLTSKQNLDLYAFWNWLNNEKNRRAELFEKYDCGDIRQYNQKVPRQDRLPRLLVFVDEFSSMCTNLFSTNDKMLQDFSALLRASRSAGISIIVSVVDKPGIFRNDNLTNQFAHAIEFRAGTLQGSLINRQGPWPQMPEGKGYCWYKNSSANDIPLVKIALVEGKDKLICEIRNKYPGAEMRLVTDDILDSHDLSSDVATRLEGKSAYARREIRIPLGVQHLFGAPQDVTFRKDMPVLSIFGDRQNSLKLIREIMESGRILQNDTDADQPIIRYGDFTPGYNESEWIRYCEDSDFPCLSGMSDMKMMMNDLKRMIAERRDTNDNPPTLIILTGCERLSNLPPSQGGANPEHLRIQDWKTLVQSASGLNLYFIMQFTALPGHLNEDFKTNYILVPDEDDRDSMQRNQTIVKLCDNRSKNAPPLEVIKNLPSDLIALCLGGQTCYIRPYQI